MVGKLVKVAVVSAGLAAVVAVGEWFRRTRKTGRVEEAADEEPARVSPHAGEVWRMCLPDVPDASQYIPLVVVEKVGTINPLHVTVTKVHATHPTGTYKRASSVSITVALDTFIRHYRKVEGPVSVLRAE